MFSFIYQRFLKKFNHDDKGIPRVWNLLSKAKIDFEFAASNQDILKFEELLRAFNIELEVEFENKKIKIEQKNNVFSNDKKDFLKLIQEQLKNEYNIALFEQVLF